jgi:anti-sigma factor RsiW
MAAGLTEFLEGDLDPETEAAAVEHLATCEHCEIVLADTREVMDLARRHGRETVSPEDRERLRASILDEIHADTDD